MPEENGDIESFHNSLMTDYIWISDIETFDDAVKLMEYAFNDYNRVQPIIRIRNRDEEICICVWHFIAYP